MQIRTATEADWPGIYQFYSAIMAEGVGDPGVVPMVWSLVIPKTIKSGR